MASVEIINGPGSGRRFELAGEQVVIGRHLDCQVVLATRSVSRRHARIFRESGDYFVEDLDSHNGMFVNGERVFDRRLLQDQDRLQIEDNTLLFREDGPTSIESRADERPTESFVIAARDSRPLRATTILKTLDARTDPRPEANSYQKLRAVLRTAQNLGSSLDTDEMLSKILESLMTIFPRASLAYAMLADGPNDELVVKSVKHRDDDGDESFTLSPENRSLAKLVMSQKTAVLGGDADAGRGVAGNASILDARSLSVMCAPLIGPSGDPLGVIHVDAEDPGRYFGEDDLELLVSLATVAGQAVEYARIHEAQIELDRQERELATARDVQLHFLPRRTPDFAGYRFFDYYQAAKVIGGDYYGYTDLPNGRLALTLGDVSGKGISAALLMARLCSEVRYSLATSRTPAEAVNRLGRELTGSVPNLRFITFVLCVLDPTSHEITVVNAGHVPPLLRRATGSEVEEIGVGCSGPPLGVRSVKPYDQLTVTLDRGDMVALYTDGVSETMNLDQELFGIGRIKDVLAGGPADVEPLGRLLLEEVQRFSQGEPQRDDICLLCFQREQ